MTAWTHGGEKDAPLARRISRGHFSLTVFFRVTRDELSERWPTRSLTGNNNGKHFIEQRLERFIAAGMNKKLAQGFMFKVWVGFARKSE